MKKEGEWLLKLVQSLGYTLPMIRLNVHQAKTHLSRHLATLEAEGEVIVLCRRNVPIAEIRPLPKRPEEPRPVGLASGSFEVPPEFFEPLPKDLQRGFEGSGE